MAEKIINKEIWKQISCDVCPVAKYGKITNTMNECCTIGQGCTTSLKIVYKRLQQCDKLLAKINNEIYTTLNEVMDDGRK